MKFKIEHLLILGLFIYIVFIQMCNKPKEVKPEIITTTITRVDSFYVTDTLVKHHTKYISYVPQVNFNIDLSDTSVFHNVFYYKQKDSLLEATILVHSEHKPDSIGLEYDLKSFTIRDSIYIRDSTDTKEIIKRSYMSFGGQLIGNKDYFGFAPQIFYNHKSGSNFGLGYDLVNSNIHLTYTKKLSFRK